MNKVILQRWEESNRSFGTQPDGCSLHLTDSDKDSYIKEIYKDRSDNIPDIYERVIGSPLVAFIEDGLYDIIQNKKTLRLQEHELNNLINLEELIIKE